MAINYTSYIPRQVIDTGTPLDQAPDFSRLMDRPDWSNRDDPYGFSRYQYLTPSDFRYWASQKQEGGDPQSTANVQRGQAATALANSYNIAAGQQPAAQPEAPKSELDQERERLRNKFQAPLHDDSNAWVQSANRGRAAIDNGQALKPTPAVFSRDFATRELPSGSPNAPINYETLGDTINEKGIQLMRDTGTWSEDELKDPSKINMNYGMHQALNAAGGLDHPQADYEAALEQARRQRAYEQNMYASHGSAAKDAMSLGIPDDSGSTGGGSDLQDSSLDWSGYDPSRYPGPTPSSQPSAPSDPFAYHNEHSPLIKFGNWLYNYNRNIGK